ncbi:MAG: biopolymer transporter ExbD [Planctomycetes bacterium]|nr:biopolymer transporter ExbD [Planctomycetota bacterium]
MGKRRVSTGDHGGDDGGHGDRPWVYFMVDCFMLITEFFVLSFKFKTEEVILPHKLPPGGTVPSKSQAILEKGETLSVYVTRSGGQAMYEINKQQYSLAQLSGTMASVVSNGKNFTVRISYERAVPWEDVMAVFNECSKVKVEKVGLVPLRGEPASGG